MPTRTASGSSTSDDAVTAGRAAVEQARTGLQAIAQVGLVFCSPRHPLGAVLEGCKQASPGTRFVACHTAGEFTAEGGLVHGSVVCLLLHSDRALFEVAGASGVGAGPAQVAKALCAPFGELSQRAARAGLGLSTTALLVDGLAGTGELVVKEVRGHTRGYQQVVGGAAGDEGQFQRTEVGTDAHHGPDSAAALHVFDAVNWGVGVDHGLRAASARFTVTRARGNRLFELDGKPAFETYRSFAAQRGLTLSPASAGPFMIGNELGVYFLDALTHARAPLSVGPHGELNLVASIVEGAQVCILDGEPAPMVAAAQRAALEAKRNLGTAKAAGVLVFDCICRGMILKEAFSEEIAAIRAVFPTEPLVGFLTYGEIARFMGRLDGWHNATTVVAAIPA